MLAKSMITLRQAVRGRSTREDVERYGSEAEDVHRLRTAFGVDQSFRGHVNQVPALRDLIRMQGVALGGCDGRARTDGAPKLPVHQPQVCLSVGRLPDQNASRVQRSVDHTSAVCVLQRFRNLTNEVEPLIKREARSILRQEVVKADFIGLPAEEYCGSQIVFFEIERPDDAGVIQTVQEVVFPEGCLPDQLAIAAGAARDVIESNSTNQLRRGMLRSEVLTVE